MKKHHLWIALIASICACGGDRGDWTPVANKRCRGDGLCVTKSDGKRLSGAFRHGDREVGFDAVSSPSFSQSIIGGEQICVRLIFDNGYIFRSADNSSCPFGFLDRRIGPPLPEEIFASYRALVPQLHQALLTRDELKTMSRHWEYIIELAGMAPAAPPSPDEQPAIEQAMTAEEVKKFPATQAELAVSTLPTLDITYASDTGEEETRSAPSGDKQNKTNPLGLSVSSSSSGTGWVCGRRRM